MQKIFFPSFLRVAIVKEESSTLKKQKNKKNSDILFGLTMQQNKHKSREVGQTMT